MALITRGSPKAFSGTDKLGPDDPNNFARSAELDVDFDNIYTEFNGGIDNANIRDTAAIDGDKLALTNYITDAHVSPAADIQGSKLLDNSIPEPKYADGSVSRRAIAADAVTEVYEVQMTNEIVMNYNIPGAGGQAGPFPVTGLVISGLVWTTGVADILVWMDLSAFATTVPGLDWRQAFEARAYADDGVSQVYSNYKRVAFGWPPQNVGQNEYPCIQMHGAFLIENVPVPAASHTIRLDLLLKAFIAGAYAFTVNPLTVPGSGNFATMTAMVRHR